MGAFLTGLAVVTVTVAMGVVVTLYAKFKLLYFAQRVVAYAAFAVMYLSKVVDFFYTYADVHWLRLFLSLLVVGLFYYCERLPLPAGASKAIPVVPIQPGMKADRKTRQEAIKNERKEAGGVNLGGLTPGYVYGESKGSLWEL